MADSPQRHELLFTGRVQGVGFRYTTQGIASRLAVSGSVRNRRDGSVELIVEGAPAEVDDLVRAVQEHFRENIDGVQRSIAPATGEYASFEIRQ